VSHPRAPGPSGGHRARSSLDYCQSPPRAWAVLRSAHYALGTRICARHDVPLHRRSRQPRLRCVGHPLLRSDWRAHAATVPPSARVAGRQAALLDVKQDALEDGLDLEYFHASEDRQAVRDQVLGCLEPHVGDLAATRSSSTSADSLPRCAALSGSTPRQVPDCLADAPQVRRREPLVAEGGGEGRGLD